MSDIIHLLPDHIANQIAAGEVIQRPASVVKELVENAIDAGAQSISVVIKDAGKTLVQVIDDGKGMSETDARMAFERHATSKISSVDDLFSLRSMGFRGEALASIAAVAQVELQTRQRGADLGTCLSISGSVVESVEPAGCAEGSSFSVKNLFFNVPARRKFLKSNETEFRNIVTEFERVALVNSHVSFSLFHNGTEILSLPESGVRQRIINVYGKALNQKLLTVDAQSSMVTISGFIGRPDSTKKRGALQYFFVNGRFMKHPYFHKAVMQAYEQLIPAGEQPCYFIYFTLDPATIDVNIHPTKTEIKFENEQPIWQILQAAVREALAKSSAIPTIDFNMDDAIDIPVYNPVTETRGNRTPPKVQLDNAYNPFGESSKETSGQYSFDWAALYKGFEDDRAAVQRELATIPFDELSDEERTVVTREEKAPQNFFPEESIVPCMQYKQRYILTCLKSGLALIDQRRAHIRILYDRYLAQIRDRQGNSQQILFPEIIEFTPSEQVLLPGLLEDLRYMGFDLSDLGGGSYSINGLPSGLENVDMVRLLHDLVAGVMEIGLDAHDQVASSLALSMAKASAIQVGKSLSAEEMDDLLASLFSSSDINLTPDGQTILSIIGDDELAKRFS